MRHGPDRRLRGAAAPGEPGRREGETRQSGSRADRTAAGARVRSGPLESLGRALAAPLHASLRGLMTVAAMVCFERIRVAGRRRFPARGPVVLIANHPAAWTDVALLDVALGRRLHFLAHEALYRPRVRGLLLRLHGALPVSFRQENVRADVRNRATFARCRALLERGEVIAVFPEGVSGGDRTLLPLRSGAARLILEHGPGAPPAVPVAIRYEDRCAFRSRVTLVVGEPVAPGPFIERCAADADAAAHVLTAAMRAALRRAMDDAAAAAATTPARSRAAGPRAAPVAALGAAGRLVHVPMTATIEALVRRFAREPQRVAFGRMVFGAVLVPAWYATIGALLAVSGAGAWTAAVAELPVLGACACLDLDRRRAAERSAAENRS